MMSMIVAARRIRIPPKAMTPHPQWAWQLTANPVPATPAGHPSAAGIVPGDRML
jgi:hypothetical protein